MTGHIDVQHTHEVMMGLPEHWRYNWCSGPCACIGGANCSGRVGSKGVSYTDWATWVQQNPDPRPPQQFNTIDDVLRELGYLKK